MKKSLYLLCLAAAILLFHGCSSKPVSVPLSERIAPQAATEGEGPSAEATAPGGKEGAISEEELARMQREKQQAAAEAVSARLKDVYFEFDSYSIRPQDMPILKTTAEWLVKDQAIKLTIEGHCDERGTTEYNLALGQKRAEAVKDVLVRTGVSASRIKSVSYGKEAPIDAGHTEDAWSKNRRAHFVSQ